MSARPKAPARLAGSVGDQPGSTDRNDSGSPSMMPTRTSPTIRPPTGPSWSPSCRTVGLLEDVEPQRCLAGPPVLGEPDLLGGQRGHPEAVRDGFTRGESDGLAALQVAVRERRVVGARRGPGDLRRQGDQRGGQPRVDALGALGRRVALDVDLQRPVDRVLGRDRAEAHQVGEHRAGAEARVDLIAIADLGVAVAVGGIGELERDVRDRRRGGTAAGRASSSSAVSGAPIRPGRNSRRITCW